MRFLVLLVVLMSSYGSSARAEDLPRKIKPVMVWEGWDTKQTKELFARCRSQEDWKAIWHKHHGSDKDVGNRICPDIDFDSYMVVVIFSTWSRLEIAEVTEERDCIRLHYEPWGNQTILWVTTPEEPGIGKEYECGRGIIDLEKPRSLSFAFLVLPKSEKALVVAEDVRDLIDAPPVWKERAKFPTLVKKQ